MYTGCFSPDGQVYAYAKTEGILDDRERIWLYNVQTGQSRQTEITGSVSGIGSIYWIDRTFSRAKY
jgi:hypothetical protein